MLQDPLFIVVAVALLIRKKLANKQSKPDGGEGEGELDEKLLTV